jgi:hypothetical protein
VPGQALEARLCGGARGCGRTPFAIGAHCIAQHVDQDNFIDRFLKKVERAVLQRRSRRGHIPVCHGHVQLTLAQQCL